MSTAIYAPGGDGALDRAVWLARLLRAGLEARQLPARDALKLPEMGIDPQIIAESGGLAAFCHGDDRGLHNASGPVLHEENLKMIRGRWLYCCACSTAPWFLEAALRQGATQAAGYNITITPDGLPHGVPEELIPLYREFIAHTVLCIREGAKDQRTVRRELYQICGKIQLWAQEHPEVMVNTIFLQQLVFNLYIHRPVPDPPTASPVPLTS